MAIVTNTVPTEMTDVPIIKFMVPAECVICFKREESNQMMHRIDLNEFKPEQLAKLPGKYLGQFVHKDMKCLGEILKFSNQ